MEVELVKGITWGGIRVGDNKWLWKTARATTPDYRGQFPPDGAYDIGNGVQYAGISPMTVGRNIIWGYHGEFWKNAQTNKWNHFYDNGLFVAQFGVTREDAPGAAPAMVAGNAFSAYLVTGTNGKLYLYHTDENTHGALHRWRIDNVNSIKEQTIPIVTSQTMRGLTGEYFQSADLDSVTRKTVRIDSVVNFAWGAGAPTGTAIVGSDNFSVRWTGFVKPLYTQNYTFSVNADEGVRLWVNDTLVIDAWGTSSGEKTGTISLAAGTAYPIRLEYADRTGAAQVALSWASPSQTKQLIPSTQLMPGMYIDYDASGVDLMAGLGFETTLPARMYGWARTPVTEVPVAGTTDGWSVITSKKSYNRIGSPDVYASFRQPAGSPTHTVTRNLAVGPAVQKWTLNGLLSYDEILANTPAAQLYFDILDSRGLIISRMYVVEEPYPAYALYFNRTRAYYASQGATMRYDFRTPEPFTITAENGVLTGQVTGLTVASTGVFDPDADWRNPATLRLQFTAPGTDNRRTRTIGLDDLYLLVE